MSNQILRPTCTEIVSEVLTYSDSEENECKICDECGTYIYESGYWKINGEILCDDCCRAKYYRRVSQYYEY